MGAILEALFQSGQQAALSFQAEGRFGNEHKIGLPQGQRRLCRDKARLPAHKLDDPDAVGDAHRLHMGATDRLRRLVHGGVEAEGLGHETDIVVDGFRNADDRKTHGALPDFRADGLGGLHRAVSADDKEHADVEPLQRIDNFGRRLRAAR